MLAGETAQDVQLERFVREGKAPSLLRTQGILGVYDLFEHQGQMLMVLECVDGLPVSMLLEQGALPLDIACIIGLKLAEALEYAHFHRILHRDIKPNNVMVSREGQVKLMDFGIAIGENLEKFTRTGVVVGTPLHMAPEVIMGQEAPGQSDLYSLGVLLYQTLSGRKRKPRPSVRATSRIYWWITLLCVVLGLALWCAHSKGWIRLLELRLPSAINSQAGS